MLFPTLSQALAIIKVLVLHSASMREQHICRKKVNRKMGLGTPVGISGRTLGSVSESGFEEGSQQCHKKSFMDKDNSQSEENNNYQHSSDTSKKNSEQLLTSESLSSSSTRPKISVLQRLKELYNDLYWPYDYDETILGLRYV